MVAVVLPPLKFAPPERGTISALALAQAGSVAPATGFGALSTRSAMTASAAEAWNATVVAPNRASANSDDDLLLMTGCLFWPAWARQVASSSRLPRSVHEMDQIRPRPEPTSCPCFRSRL